MKVQFGQRHNRTIRPAPTQARPEVPRQQQLRQQAAQGPSQPKQFQPFAAGKKAYGGGRPMPNLGRTANRTGYAERDAKMAARRQAFIDRAKRF